MGGPLSLLISLLASTWGANIAPSAEFAQRCFRVRSALLPNFFVDFRPDIQAGGRVEAVFWNGEVDPLKLTVVSGHIRDLPSYAVTITNGGSTIYSATIPHHYWATRWRYQSADRPVILESGPRFLAIFSRICRGWRLGFQATIREPSSYCRVTVLVALAYEIHSHLYAARYC